MIGAIGRRTLLLFMVPLFIPWSQFVLPMGNSLKRALYAAAAPIVEPWGRLLGLAATPPAGFVASADTSYDWAYLTLVALLAVSGGIGWTLARPRPYPQLGRFLLTATRYWVGSTMIAYSVVKLVPYQFSFPDAERLATPVGDLSPMGLMWTMMGFSAFYAFFTALVELLAGVLLFSRRTATLGALFSMAAMGNITVMDLSYDVPVKSLAFALFVASTGIVATDLSRLLNVLVLDRPAPPRDLKRLTLPGPLGGLAVPLKTLVLVVLIAPSVVRMAPEVLSGGRRAAPDDGVFEVDQASGFDFDANRVTLVGRTLKVWNRQHRIAWEAVVAGKGTERKLKRDKTVIGGVVLTDDRLVLTGEVELEATRQDSWLLRDRGFHLVNEVPFRP